jgi:hypothetical protein
MQQAPSLGDRTLWLLLCLTIGAGCSDGTARVRGKITFNGEPVTRGMINLEPADGVGPVMGASVTDGTYDMRGVLPGEKIVRISAVYSKGIQRDPSDGSEIEICDDLLPPEYGQMSTQRLTVEAPETNKDYSIEAPDPRKPGV